MTQPDKSTYDYGNGVISILAGIGSAIAAGFTILSVWDLQLDGLILMFNEAAAKEKLLMAALILGLVFFFTLIGGLIGSSTAKGHEFTNAVIMAVATFILVVIACLILRHRLEYEILFLVLVGMGGYFVGTTIGQRQKLKESRRNQD